MAEAATGGPAPFTAHFDLRHLRAGEHTLVIPIPDGVLALMANVVVLWGAFELRMDLLIGVHFEGAIAT